VLSFVVVIFGLYFVVVFSQTGMMLVCVDGCGVGATFAMVGFVACERRLCWNAKNYGCSLPALCYITL
jgi:hypothetical protein